MVSKDQIVHDLAVAFAQEEYRVQMSGSVHKAGDFIPRMNLFCKLYEQGVAVAAAQIEDIVQSYLNDDGALSV